METIQLQVKTHDGLEYIEEVTEYDPVSLNEMLNDTTINTIVIGGVIEARINIKRIAKVSL